MTVDSCMNFTSFTSFLAAQEGLLAPDQAPVPGLPRLNFTGQTNAERQRLRVVPVRPPTSAVRPVVPPKLIPRNLRPPGQSR